MRYRGIAWVSCNGTLVRTSDSIPGGSATLKVMSSGLYHNEPASSFNGTKGLYCASCHTPHSGQLLAGSALLSSKPNHATAAVTTEAEFCASCHDNRDNVGAENNHPSDFCIICHDANAADFPHTSANSKLLMSEPDALCNVCHPSSGLP